MNAISHGLHAGTRTRSVRTTGIRWLAVRSLSAISTLDFGKSSYCAAAWLSLHSPGPVPPANRVILSKTPLNSRLLFRLKPGLRTPASIQTQNLKSPLRVSAVKGAASSSVGLFKTLQTRANHCQRSPPTSPAKDDRSGHDFDTTGTEGISLGFFDAFHDVVFQIHRHAAGLHLDVNHRLHRAA
ncbi:hypothetical protein SAMN02745166_02599 [Prosthecobacter debontii]|uniref:Uncharacterized protein n=1 Tax=Prosthecobacter debontii TaxID=48467 RepID=A0A1T4Y6J5_9BACT|nr:hypothetical protein SAMN02745166_02599 [Prosthecobacter debontii]